MNESHDLVIGMQDHVSPSVQRGDMTDDFDAFDFPENSAWCERCQGTGSVECYCGGDQCYCRNGGERDCPRCYGERSYFVRTVLPLSSAGRAG